MSFHDNQEEFQILLEMGQESENGVFLSPKIKLFKMWAKRVPLEDRIKIFQNVPPQKWKKLEYPANFWAFEQKLLTQDSINCPIEKLWPLDAYPPDDIPHLVIERLKSLLETTAPAKTVVEFIINIEDNSNNWALCSKNPQLIQHMNDVIEKATKKSHSLANALLTAFPDQLNKKLNQLDTSVSASHMVVSKFLSALSNPATPMEQEFLNLSQVEPSSILANDEVVRKVKSYFAQKPFSIFKKNTDVLVTGKWKNKDIVKICPTLSSYTPIKILKEFLPFWLSNASTQKSVREVCNEKLLEVLNGPSKEIPSVIKWFNELSKAGVTQQDYNIWLEKSLISDPWGGLYDIIKRPKKLLDAIEKNKEKMVEVFPNQLVGTLMVFQHLANQTPLDTTYPSLKLASPEEMEKALEDSYYFSHTDVDKIRSLAIQLQPNIDKLNLTSAIKLDPTSTPKKSRKM